MNLCSSRNVCFNWLIDPHPDVKLTASRLLPTSCSGYIPYIKNWKCKCSLEGLKYIPVKLHNLIKISLQTLIDTIRLDLDRWDRLLLSLWGKYTIMTMNILPHLISLCKAHTNRIPKLNFAVINNLSVKFYGIAKAQKKIHC